jgi:FtsP/CotA-like multicopper oxidase with cupredoxin domain
MTGGAMGKMSNISYNGNLLSGNDFQTTKQLWAFNGTANLTSDPFFSANRGETIIVESYNDTAFPHAIHLHGHHFKVLTNSEGIIEEPAPWRDTFLIAPRQVATIAFVADNPGKWLLHCHMLEHAAAGMNSWFEVS